MFELGRINDVWVGPDYIRSNDAVREPRVLPGGKIRLDEMCWTGTRQVCIVCPQEARDVALAIEEEE
jgi:hypothetical protein